MEHKGILMKVREWMGLRGKRRKGQLTTLIILFLAVAALCAAALINISRVAIRKASIANAASGAALQLASNIGSYARMMAITQFCDGHPCDTDHKCKFSWLGLVMILVLIVLIVIAIIFPPAWAGVGLIGAAAVAAAVSTFVSIILKFTVFDPQMYKAMNRAFEKLSQNQQFIESAVRYGFMNTVDDRAEVIDMTDLDMNGKYGFNQSPDPDNPGMWVRAQDRDGNDIPEQTISRFYYKYMMRVLYLSEFGPPPPGQTSGYREQMKALIAEFMPALARFWRTTLDISELIGDLPNNGNCQTTANPPDNTYRYSNCIPSVPDPLPSSYYDESEYIRVHYFNTIASGSCVLDPWKGSLYFLFSFLETIKSYPKVVLNDDVHTVLFSRNEPLYRLNYYPGSDGPINRWTAGIEACSEVDGVDEDISALCYQSTRNDELDALAYSLDAFNRVPVDTDDQDIGFATTMINPAVLTGASTGPSTGGGYTGGGFTGGGNTRHPINLNQIIIRTTNPTTLIQALTGLNLSDDDRARIFDDWWYHGLYNRCISGIDSEICNSSGKTICGDDCDPAQGACAPDLEDYYDIIGGPDRAGEPKIEDNLNTPYLHEKSWYDAVSDWIPWLEQIRDDIGRAALALPEDSWDCQYALTHGTHRGSLCAGQACQSHDNTWDKRGCELCRLWYLVNNAITKLRTFQAGMVEFRAAVLALRDKYDALQCGPNLQGNEDYLMYSKDKPTYVWNDSLGRHTVKVIVAPFSTPKLKGYRRGLFTKCVKVEASHGTVAVTVERTDDPKDARFPGGGGFFWTFWNPPKISYTVWADYSHHTNGMPTINRIKKN